MTGKTLDTSASASASGYVVGAAQIISKRGSPNEGSNPHYEGGRNLLYPRYCGLASGSSEESSCGKTENCDRPGPSGTFA